MIDSSDDHLAIETRGLKKRFRNKRVALSGVDLQVPRGEVVGLLGPNGAGKTTLIRILLGLAKASGGEARIFGNEVPSRLSDVLPKVGAVLEAPSFYPTMSARNNLRALATLSGDPGAKGRIAKLLDQVGLSDRATDSVGGFSQGMRQRLALAAALLHQHELLILDEPLTGFDPAGVVEARDLFTSLNRQGVTIFLSSHFLSEVERSCDRFIFIRQGVIAGEYDRASLKHRLSRVSVSPGSGSCLRLFSELGWSVTREDSSLIVEGVSREEVEQLLTASGVRAEQIVQSERSLEELFLQLTSEAVQ